MKLYLIRHAQAEDGSPDFDRRLTAAGRERSRLVASWMKPFLSGSRLWTSPAARAREMAEILYEMIDFEGKLKKEALYYSGGAEAISEELSQLDLPVVAVVGHEPLWTEVASLLVWGEIRGGLDLKKGGVIRIDMGDGQDARLRWLLDPKMLERM